jgi:hypothetical protein
MVLNGIVSLVINPDEVGNIRKDSEVRNFVIFMGQHPGEDHLSMLSSQDTYLILENIVAMDMTGIEMAVRAGVIYNNANNIIFAAANNYPSLQQSVFLFDTLKKDSTEDNPEILAKDGLVCVSKEYLLFYGFDNLYEKCKETLIDKSHKSSTDDISNQLDLAKAMSGNPCSDQIIVQAIHEIVVPKTICINNHNKNTDMEDFWNDFIKSSDITLDLKANMIVFLGVPTKQQLDVARNEIPQDGIVIINTDKVINITRLGEPYQILKSDKGWTLYMYTHQ